MSEWFPHTLRQRVFINKTRQVDVGGVANETQLECFAETDTKIHLERHLTPTTFEKHGQRNLVRPHEVLELPKREGANGAVVELREVANFLSPARRRERREERRCLLLLRRSVAHGDRFFVFFVF